MSPITRRSLLKTAAVSATGFILPSLGASKAVSAAEKGAETVEAVETYVPKGKIRQSVSKWCFGKYPLDEFCRICKKLGMPGIDLLDPDAWDLMLKNDMIVTMGNVPGASIPVGFNKLQNHDKLVEAYERVIPLAAEKKVPNLICFSGNREGTSDEEGIENCVIGLKRVLPSAEKHGVTLQMELLNARGHKDYHCDHTKWGAEIARKIGSERFKLLYDIFHMQIMEGNIIDTIKEYKDVIGHYHTAGVPGRKDLDEHQELFYPPIMRAILATGFTGFVAHEFHPKSDLQSLRQAIEVCDVT